MLAQFCPVVKPIAGNLLGIRLVGFHFAQGVVAIVFNKLRINRADKDAFFVKEAGHRLIVPPGVLHDHPCLTGQAFQVVCQLLEFTSGVTDRKWLCHHFPKGTENRYHALSFGNIDPCHIVHSAQLPIVDLSFGFQPFHHCRSNLFDDTGAPVWRLNLHKSNAGNERLADGLLYGRKGPRKETPGQDTPHSNSLGNDTKKDMAGCRAFNRKSIVIERWTEMGHFFGDAEWR